MIEIENDALVNRQTILILIDAQLRRRTPKQVRVTRQTDRSREREREREEEREEERERERESFV